jgi:hypothetical protein
MKGADERAAAAARAAATSADAYERFVTQANAAGSAEAAAAPAAADGKYGVPVAVAASKPDLAAVRTRLRRPRCMSRTLPRPRLRPVPRLHRVWERP